MRTHRNTERSDSSQQDDQGRNKSGHDSGSIVATITQRQVPSRRQIAAAIIESSKARAHQLIAGETLDLARPFTVFSRLEVKKIKIKHERGSVTLQVSVKRCPRKTAASCRPEQLNTNSQ